MPICWEKAGKCTLPTEQDVMQSLKTFNEKY